MNNQMMGTAGVFALTFLLLALRHFFLSLGQPKKSRPITPTTRHQEYESHKSADDRAWLLWNPEHDSHTDQPKRPGFGDRRGTSGTRLPS